jgi:L-ascorbate metabolism protein UlaG (beta-lactamase superfamily)
MKITYITQACVLIEACGIKILTDPWLVGPCFAGNLWHFPPPKRKPEDFTGIDVIYFSHAHEDHFQLESIDRLPLDAKEALVLIPDFKARYFEPMVKAAGFKNVKVLAHDSSIELADGLSLDMLVNDKGDHDSSIVLKGDGSTVFFQTDNLMSLAEANRLGKKYDIDLLFAVTMLTGIFPGFYDFPPEEMAAYADQKRKSATDYSISVVEALGAKHMVPYASDLCYFGDHFFANALHRGDKKAYLATLKERLPGVEGIQMWPDDEIELHDGKVTAQVTPLNDGLPELATYAATMEEEFSASEQREYSRTGPPLAEAVRKFRSRLESYAESAWKGGAFNVLWKVVDEDGTASCFNHTMTAPPQECAENWPCDLSIEIPLSKLRRLIHGDYLMGLMALWNGSLRCHRSLAEYSPDEAMFWKWALSFRF